MPSFDTPTQKENARWGRWHWISFALLLGAAVFYFGTGDARLSLIAVLMAAGAGLQIVAQRRESESGIRAVSIRNFGLGLMIAPLIYALTLVLLP